jgi:hypothetical protein
MQCSRIVKNILYCYDRIDKHRSLDHVLRTWLVYNCTLIGWSIGLLFIKVCSDWLVRVSESMSGALQDQIE